MTLAAGTRLGAYEVGAPVGSGGMGDVYRATDTRLDRDVALKVLPEAFAADPDQLSRFEREAKVLAALNHPNIAHVYGFESARLADGSGVHFLAMELVPGEDLAERLKRGPLAVAEALAAAKQVAEALEEAHEKGIVHRDLKPANVKITPGGKVKVLDFGLAKAYAAGSGSGHTSVTRTTGPHATEAGVVLGTAAYMSPEQARGQPVDRRADIWSFGVLLYEMLTGDRLFRGDTTTDILAAVLRQPVDWTVLPADTPREVRALLRRCLERASKDRLHDVADARIALEDAGLTDDVSPVSPARPRWSGWLGPALVGMAVGSLMTALLDRTLLPPPAPEPPMLTALTSSGADFGPSAAPDGRTVAFTSARDGRLRIWLKQLATGEEVALTAGPVDFAPAWSPDGHTLLYLRGSEPPFELHRVAAVGGASRKIAGGIETSAAWSPDGARIAVTRRDGVIASISADGNGEQQIARLTDVRVLGLQWSPDGRTIAAWTQLRSNFAALQAIQGLDAGTGKLRPLYDPGPGSLLGGWGWEPGGGLLVAAARTQALRGGQRLMRIPASGGAPETLLNLTQPSADLDVLGRGRIVIDQLWPTQHLTEWTLPSGAEPAAELRVLTRGGSVDRQPVYAADGRRLAYNSDRSGNLDIWERDLETGIERRLTTDPADDWDPAYTADGRLLWSSNRSGNFEVWVADADGSGARKLSADGVDAENPTATPDGRWVVYGSANPAKPGVYRMGLDGAGATLIAAGVFTIPEVSPDGRWVAVVEIESGRRRLRVIAVDDGSDVASIDLPAAPVPSQEGRSRWLPGTSTLLWLHSEAGSGVRRIVSQEIQPGRDTSASRRILVVGTRESMPDSFAVSPNGQRLAIALVRNRSELLLVDGLTGIEGR